MLMPDDELAVMLRQAKDKRSQVGVLADLNLCSPYEMALHLQALGLFAGTELHPEQFSNVYKPVESAEKAKKRRKPRRKKAAPFDEARALEMFRSGISDAQMAVKLGTTARIVLNWRMRNGLLRDRGGKREKKTKKEDQQMARVVNEKGEPVDPYTEVEYSETAASAAHMAPTTCVAAEAAAIDWSECGELHPLPKSEPETMTVAQFLATLTELLTPAATRAALWINGAPVRELAALHIRSDGDCVTVEIETEV